MANAFQRRFTPNLSGRRDRAMGTRKMPGHLGSRSRLGGQVLASVHPQKDYRQCPWQDTAEGLRQRPVQKLGTLSLCHWVETAIERTNDARETDEHSGTHKDAGWEEARM